MSVTKTSDINQSKQGRNSLSSLTGSESSVHYRGESVTEQLMHGGQKVEQNMKELG